MPPFIARSMPSTLPTVAPVPAPTLPWAKSPLVARRPRLVAHRRVGARRGVSDDEVEEDGRGDQRDAGDADVEADALLFQEADDAVGGGEAEGAAAGQEQGVGAPDGAYRARGGPSRGCRARSRARPRPRRPLRVLEEDGRAAGDGPPRRWRGPRARPARRRGCPARLALRSPRVAGFRQFPLSVSAGSTPGLSRARRPSGTSSWSERFVPNWTTTESLTIE